ncbi:MAG TPA: hypothetical protein VGF84_13230 [Micromonosporaceae bacterium]|jgi:hypothetical protein
MNNDIPVQSQTRGAHEASDEYAYEPTTDVNLDSDPFADDLSKELSHAAPKTWVNRTTLVIGGLVLIVGGFLGGVQVQKSYGKSSSTSATPNLAQLRSQFGRGGEGGNAAAGGGFPGAGTGATGTRGAATPQTGKITLVDGSTIYVTLSDGTVLTVSTSSKTQVSVATTSKVSALKKGQTVTIVGSTPDSTGKVTATSVTATK